MICTSILLTVNKNENKLSGISYRLLNALKLKNEQKFMEVIFYTYKSIEKEIPTIFIDVLVDRQKFIALGYAFLFGLNGELEKEKGADANANAKN